MMKKYNQFINENISGDFSFAINIKNCTNDKLNKIFEEIEKNFNNFEEYTSFNKHKFFIKFFNYRHFTEILILEIYTYTSYPSTKSKRIIISEANSSGHITFTPEEFLEMGFEGCKEEVDLKKNMKKYNL